MDSHIQLDLDLEINVACIHSWQALIGLQCGQGQVSEGYCETKGNQIYRRGNKNEMNNDLVKSSSPW